jgi:hypothetical protein
MTPEDTKNVASASRFTCISNTSIRASNISSVCIRARKEVVIKFMALDQCPATCYKKNQVNLCFRDLLNATGFKIFP